MFFGTAFSVICNMSLIRQTSVTIFFLCCFHLSTAFACGYSFVGSCASAIALTINGTRDSFQLSPCEFEPPMDGLNLGAISNLRLTGANTTTWESCINNVTGAFMYYRVYEKNGTPTNWQRFALGEDNVRLEGPYTTRHRSHYPEIDLVKNLIQGKQYILETYILAEVDTLGDDFLPETFMLLNNDGKNYQLTFTYGGSTAPPFIVLPTRKQPTRCYGDSTGIAGVTVYGNQTGIFYAWAGFNNNFHTLYQLPAGTYTVTVSGAANHTQVVQITVTQPTPLTATFSDIEPAGCNNTAGRAKVAAGGGNAPYNYAWNTGQQGETSSIPTPGVWRVTVTDAGTCKKTFSVNIPGDNTVSIRQFSGEICNGETYTLYGRSFREAGAYSFTLPNPGGCDTLVKLQLAVVKPDTAVNLLPDSVRIICLSPIIDLCAKNIAGASYKWTKLGSTLSSNRCFQANAGGHYLVSVTLNGATKACTATKDVFVVEKLSPPSLSLQSGSFAPCSALDSVEVWLEAQTNAEMPVFEWTIEGKKRPCDKRCLIKLAPDQFFINSISVSVTDQYGCKNSLNNLSFAGVRPVYLEINNTAMTVASGPTKADGTATVNLKGGTPPYRYRWSNNAVTNQITGLLPGLYCVTATDAANCSVVGCVRVDFISAATEVETEEQALMYPNPAYPGAVLRLRSNNALPEWPKVTLFDALGRQLTDSQTFNPETGLVLPAGLTADVLWLSITGKHFSRFEKIVLLH